MKFIRPRLPKPIQKLADTTEWRIDRYPQRFDRDGQHYAQCADILLLSRFNAKEWFFNCGCLKHPCGNKACPTCGHKRRMEILSKFLPVFDSVDGEWGYITLSSQRPHYCGDGYCDNLEMIWDAYRYAFERMTDDGEFQAVILAEEFGVISYFPIPEVVAHVHAVVLTTKVSMEKTDRLRSLVESYPGWVKVSQEWVVKKNLRKRIEEDLVDRKHRWLKLYDCQGVPFDLSTRTYRIQRETDFAGVLGYLAKHIDWSERYIAEWPENATDELRYDFNHNVDLVIDAWQFFSGGRTQLLYLGDAHHAKTNFLGIPKKKRQTERQKMQFNALLEYCKEERLFDPDELGQPLETFREVKADDSQTCI